MAAPTEERYVVRGLELAVKLWTAPRAKQRILAWPGWLDNAGSFDTLAPLLVAAGYTVAAVDPPGCGRSAHRPKWCAYNDWEESLLAVALAEEGMGWPVDEPFIMMGHSRGGNLMALSAAAFPERVVCLVSLDGVLGLAGTHPGVKSENPKWHRASYDAELKIRDRPPKTSDSMDAAIDRTHTGDIYPKSRRTAENLVRRSVTELSDGSVEYIVDMRTYSTVTAPVVIEEEQMKEEFFAKVQCPMLHLKADDHYSKFDPQAGGERSMAKDRAEEYKALLRSREAAFPTYEGIVIDQATHNLAVNSHHVHSDAPEVVAGVLIPWLDAAVAAAPDRPAPNIPSTDGPQSGTFAGGRPAGASGPSRSTAGVSVAAGESPTAEDEADMAEVRGVSVTEGSVAVGGGLRLAYKRWCREDASGSDLRLLMYPVRADPFSV